jgi:hypothetical protein
MASLRFPARWPIAALGRRWPEQWWAVPAGFAACAPREGERGKDDQGFGKVIELSGKVLKTRVI